MKYFNLHHHQNPSIPCIFKEAKHVKTQTFKNLPFIIEKRRVIRLKLVEAREFSTTVPAYISNARQCLNTFGHFRTKNLLHREGKTRKYKIIGCGLSWGFCGRSDEASQSLPLVARSSAERSHENRANFTHTKPNRNVVVVVVVSSIFCGFSNRGHFNPPRRSII